MAEVFDWDILASAKALVKDHGPRAVDYANARAEELFDAGDVRGSMVWRRVIMMIEHLQAMEPKGRIH